MIYTETIYIVMGRPKVGKSTTSGILARLLNKKWGDTSDIIYKVLADRRGTTVDVLRRIPKEELRPDLIVVGNELCNHSPLALSYALVQNGCNIICGVRRKSELTILVNKLKLDGFNVVTVWVDRDQAPTTEDNTEVTKNDCGVRINNSWDLIQLEKEISWVFVEKEP